MNRESSIFAFGLKTENFLAAARWRKMATISRTPAIQLPIAPQQRHLPALSPRLRHNGGCSRVCRRSLWRKSRKVAAVPVPAAAHLGSNSANPATSPNLPSSLTPVLIPNQKRTAFQHPIFVFTPYSGLSFYVAPGTSHFLCL